MSTVAEMIVTALGDLGVRSVWGVVGDALNPLTEAIRQDGRVEWIGVRHEEVGAFAVSAQSQLSGTIGVCMGTVGPGSIHLLNGLYDAKKSRTPVLAVCGQVPVAELGNDMFQEVDNDLLFRDVAVFARTVTSPSQLPQLLEQAVNSAVSHHGVSVLTLPGDLGDLELPDGTPAPRFAPPAVPSTPAPAATRLVADVLADAGPVTLLVGMGARDARAEVLELAERLAAPMVLTLKGKEGLERDNPFQVGQTGLIGNPAAAQALDDCEVLFLVGTDFPYRDWIPTGKTVIQLDSRPEHIGRRAGVDYALVGMARETLQALLPLLGTRRKRDRGHLEKSRAAYGSWLEGQARLADPRHDRKLLGRLRSKTDNPDDRIRPEALAEAVDRYAADDAIFTVDTGMSTAWASRLIHLRGTRRLVGSFNLGSMANALPHGLGAQALDRRRQVVALCGDGGLMMLLGDLRTAVTHDLPLTVVVFDNGQLGMVKLEQEQGGLPEFGTALDNPDLAAVASAMGLSSRVVGSAKDVDEAVRWALAERRPTLLDVRTNPTEVALPPKTKPGQAWGFAIAKMKESISSPE